jgi:hypothetical protein
METVISQPDPFIKTAIIDCLSRAANLIRIGIAKYSEADPGAFVLVHWREARSGNGSLQTKQIFRQSLASQVTSQIAGPEINVTFRYNPKKVRRAWGIFQVIIDLILSRFLKNTQRQTRGSTELLFKNLLYDVHKEKVWRS